MRRYKTILIDPPWPLRESGRRNRRKGAHGKARLPYPTMEWNQLLGLPVPLLAERGCHLWLWTVNQYLLEAVALMRAWGFTYLAPIHWIKPSGMGNYFVHRTQTLLFGYYQTCRFTGLRFAPNIIEAAVPKRHSEKPEESYRLIEEISVGPRVELFARRRRPNWDAWGNEVVSDFEINCS